ncbi:hypothetical protein JRQ81_003725 [Phrynocephalus forsythii]|uniref:Secreted protein n=1 Tax=Phrynocephalus forsythii TaxID=171643 RepID=A0A9Q1AXY8_9SAUR|nr:hypothetical protein JRQ81_003725 [Phrynocephalus forsythii]
MPGFPLPLAAKCFGLVLAVQVFEHKESNASDSRVDARWSQSREKTLKMGITSESTSYASLDGIRLWAVLG